MVENAFFVYAQYDILAYGFFKANHTAALIFPPYTLYIKPQNFAERQCERQWLTPPTEHLYYERLGAVVPRPKVSCKINTQRTALRDVLFYYLFIYFKYNKTKTFRDTARRFVQRASCYRKHTPLPLQFDAHGLKINFYFSQNLV